MRSPGEPLLRFWSAHRLPVLLQTEAAECGLVCLAMVASFWGHRIDVAGMRRRFNVSRKGLTLGSLIGASDALSLRSRPLQVGLEGLGSLKLPCLLHWDMNHFVVLKAVRGGKLAIHDPAVGMQTLSMADASRHFTGIALEVTPADNFRPQEERQRVGFNALIGHVVGLRRSLAQLLVMGIALQAFALAAPFYMQWVVDEALVAGDRDLIMVLGLGFLMLALMQTAVGAVRSWVTTAMATDLNYQWFGNAFAHLMKLPLPYFEKRHLGDIVSRFGSIQTIQHSLTTQAVEGVIDALLVSGALAAMLLYSPALAAVPLVAMGLYGLMRWCIFRSMREATAQQIIHAAKQQSHFLESARGVQSIRLFCRAEERRIGWMNLLVDQFNAELRVARLTISHQTASNLLVGAERVVLIWLAALAVVDTRLSMGMLFAFISYKEQFCQRLIALIDKLFELRMLRLHAERVADIVLCEAEEDRGAALVDPQHVEASIELRNVSFRYADGEPWVLRGLDLAIPAGQCVALTGASGCGKTTLVKVLLGLLEPTEGEVLVGGTPLRQLGLANYRQMVGTVMQEDSLFAGSIADNISFFSPQAEPQQVEASALAAAIHAEILAMPMAYNTLIGDIGSGLSGGQKQRVLLARALYRNPRFLVLDEATSHLDARNEQLVNAAVRGVAMTRVLVAHRTETIGLAQRVVVLEQGRVLKDFEQQAVGSPPPRPDNEPQRQRLRIDA